MAKKKKKKKISLQERILLVAFFMTSLVFYKVAIILLIGMLPTIVVRLVDKTPERTKVLTIGFMNFAGCFPYCFQMFEKNAEAASIGAILANPLSIVIMYSGALVGYIIEWGVVGFVASIMVQRGRQRLLDIRKTQEGLVKKWGAEVTGGTMDNEDDAIGQTK
ncbi:MAG: hypothetical protein DI586_05355 [Micavibrio aeruginosavorus]|uniref:Uncharacterized protein n=1 Tax=Micavibrio aeruginosavorus TaxID=349221 RepID=A0A2W5HQB3_9BACT|nr:MAG: hypothetical protein DI586_05355 [Micavibrio aeruginosavorus]